MKLKNSIRKKILPSLLIAATLCGVTDATTFAFDNSSTTNSVNEASRMSKEESQKILGQLSRTRGAVKYYNTSYGHYVLIEYGSYLYFFDLRTSQLITGLVTICGDTFYFSRKDGTAQKGWYNVKDSNEYNGRYYFNPETCTAFKNGIYTIGGYRYVFKSDGRIQTGLGKVYGDIYYTNYKGEIVTGWQTVNGHRYFFDPMRNGIAKTGWYTDGNAGQMYFNADGTMANGWTTIDGKKYLFQTSSGSYDAYPKIGWYTDGYRGFGITYYFDINNNHGGAVTKYQVIDGKEYVFDNLGALQYQGSKNPTE